MNIAEYFQAKEAEIIEKIRQLVEIESPSHDLEGSRKVAGWITENYPDLKVEGSFAEGFGEHLIIRAFTDSRLSPLDSRLSTLDSSLFLLGHTDTVHPRGAHQKNPTRIEGDKFYGCGIFDMKANVVVMLEVIKALSELNLKSPLANYDFIKL